MLSNPGKDIPEGVSVHLDHCFSITTSVLEFKDDSKFENALQFNRHKNKQNRGNNVGDTL